MHARQWGRESDGREAGFSIPPKPIYNHLPYSAVDSLYPQRSFTPKVLPGFPSHGLIAHGLPNLPLRLPNSPLYPPVVNTPPYNINEISSARLHDTSLSMRFDGAMKQNVAVSLANKEVTDDKIMSTSIPDWYPTISPHPNHYADTSNPFINSFIKPTPPISPLVLSHSYDKSVSLESSKSNGLIGPYGGTYQYDKTLSFELSKTSSEMSPFTLPDQYVRSQSLDYSKTPSQLTQLPIYGRVERERTPSMVSSQNISDIRAQLEKLERRNASLQALGGGNDAIQHRANHIVPTVSDINAAQTQLNLGIDGLMKFENMAQSAFKNHDPFSRHPQKSGNAIVSNGRQSGQMTFDNICKDTEPSWRKRERQGRARNVSRYGPLTDLPDYSYVDGRTVQLTPRQTQRLENRKQFTSRIMMLLDDINRAEKNHRLKIHEDKHKIDQIQQKQLKAKLTPH